MNLRKYFLLVALALTAALNCTAQLGSNGFYRFHNVQENDYISLANDQFSYQFLFGTITGGGLSNLVNNSETIKPLLLDAADMYMKSDIHLVEDDECIDPSTILYLSKYSGSKYNIIAQGTSLLTLTTGNYVASVRLYFNDLYTTVSSSGNSNNYTASINIAASGVENISYNSLAFALGKSTFMNNAKLGTRYFVDNTGIFAIAESSSTNNAKWKIEPVTHFNVKPEVEYGGKYYTTLYVPFAFELSNGVEKAYVVSAINADGTLEIVEYDNGAIVPAGTPVILECSSNVASDCQLIPTGTPIYSAPDATAKSAPTSSTSSNYSGTNLLKGNYFCNQDAPYSYGKYTSESGGGVVNATLNLQNYTARKNNMYTIGITPSSGKLGFVKATGTAMPANKAWIEYDGSAELVLPIENSTLKGDVNHDGKVDVADVTTLVDYILGNTPPGFDTGNCDVNDDKKIDVGDVTSLVDIILNNN
jgi:hypothetical protein